MKCLSLVFLIAKWDKISAFLWNRTENVLDGSQLLKIYIFRQNLKEKCKLCGDIVEVYERVFRNTTRSKRSNSSAVMHEQFWCLKFYLFCWLMQKISINPPQFVSPFYAKILEHLGASFKILTSLLCGN